MAIHPDLEPLGFLLGRWEGVGIGGYPTIESFRFGQEISFSHNGKPFLIYASRTWRLDEDGRIGPPLGTGTDWTRSASPGTRCLPGLAGRRPHGTSCRRVGG